MDSVQLLTMLQELSLATLVLFGTILLIVNIFRYIHSSMNINANQIKGLLELLTKSWGDLETTMKELNSLIIALKEYMHTMNSGILSELSEQRKILEEIKKEVKALHKDPN